LIAGRIDAIGRSAGPLPYGHGSPEIDNGI